MRPASPWLGIAAKLMAEFREFSEFRHLANSPNGYAYKPFYRTISLLLAPDGLTPGASREEVAAILLAADPYFEGALVRDRRTFDSLYDNFIDLYPADGDGEEDEP